MRIIIILFFITSSCFTIAQNTDTLFSLNKFVGVLQQIKVSNAPYKLNVNNLKDAHLKLLSTKKIIISANTKKEIYLLQDAANVSLKYSLVYGFYKGKFLYATASIYGAKTSYDCDSNIISFILNQPDFSNGLSLEKIDPCTLMFNYVENSEYNYIKSALPDSSLLKALLSDYFESFNHVEVFRNNKNFHKHYYLKDKWDVLKGEHWLRVIS